MLLGASMFWHLLGTGRIQEVKGSIIIQELKFGWIIAGSVQLKNSIDCNKSYCGISADIAIQNHLERFWHTEEIEQPSSRSVEEDHCEQHFVNTHTRNEEGCFIVQLSLKEGIERFV